jgi:argininosuccinate lyase
MPLWDSRFKKPLADSALRFSSSIDLDKRLFREDIRGSLAHVEMLVARHVLRKDEGRRIVRALKEIQKEIEHGKLDLSWQREDIHLAIESRLIEKLGPLGGKLHTGRSRNDQVALDERLYLRSAADNILKAIRTLQRVLLRQSEKNRDVLVPGYTHLQRAQPILFAHHLLAYISMFQRDYERLVDCRQRMNKSPLGAAALAGTSFPIDRMRVARRLGFDGIIENSIDAVSDRDYLVEFISCCAVTMMHLSRLAEEVVLWSSEEWGFADIEDTFTTGSSIMPQKKNPDIAELVRGKVGRVYGDLINTLTVMKGLPLAYNRDMQEDKLPMFDAVLTVTESLRVLAEMLSRTKFNKERFDTELQKSFSTATEVADYLVRKGIPFRRAHKIAGKLVRDCADRGIGLSDVSLKEYQKYSAAFNSDIFKFLDPQVSIREKKSSGSTSPEEVGKQLRGWRRRLSIR